MDTSVSTVEKKSVENVNLENIERQSHEIELNKELGLEGQDIYVNREKIKNAFSDFEFVSKNEIDNRLVKTTFSQKIKYAIKIITSFGITSFILSTISFISNIVFICALFVNYYRSVDAHYIGFPEDFTVVGLLFFAGLYVSYLTGVKNLISEIPETVSKIKHIPIGSMKEFVPYGAKLRLKESIEITKKAKIENKIQYFIAMPKTNAEIREEEIILISKNKSENKEKIEDPIMYAEVDIDESEKLYFIVAHWI